MKNDSYFAGTKINRFQKPAQDLQPSQPLLKNARIPANHDPQHFLSQQKKTISQTCEVIDRLHDFAAQLISPLARSSAELILDNRIAKSTNVTYKTLALYALEALFPAKDQRDLVDYFEKKLRDLALFPEMIRQFPDVDHSLLVHTLLNRSRVVNIGQVKGQKITMRLKSR